MSKKTKQAENELKAKYPLLAAIADVLDSEIWPADDMGDDCFYIDHMLVGHKKLAQIEKLLGEKLQFRLDLVAAVSTSPDVAKGE